VPHLHCCVKVLVIQVVFHRQVKVVIVVQVLLLVFNESLHHKLSSTLDHTSKLPKTPGELDIYSKPRAIPTLLRQSHHHRPSTAADRPVYTPPSKPPSKLPKP
jgi:hypothetical protein